MSVTIVIDISSTSKTSAEEAVSTGIAKVCPDASQKRDAWIRAQKVTVEGGKITAYRVNLQITCVGDGDKSKPLSNAPWQPRSVGQRPTLQARAN